jgi:hypothetical protein
MPKVKKIAAAVAVSTALTGGVVVLGAATTGANAAVTPSVSLMNCGGGGCGGGFRDGFDGFGDGFRGRCHGKRHVNRTTVKIHHDTGRVRFRHVRGCLHIRKNFNVIGGDPIHD